MQASDLFGESPFARKSRLESALKEAFDSFPQCRLPRLLFESLVSALMGAVPGEHLSLSQFSLIFNVVKSKLATGEPALGLLVGKERPDLSDEWIYAVKAEYFAPVASAKKRTSLFQKGDPGE